MLNENDSHPEPKNHSGLKWFLGTIFFVAFSSALLLYSAYIITSERVLNPMMAKTLNIVFRQDGMKETERVVTYVNELYKQRDAIKSFTELDPAKVQSDIATMSPEESEKYLQDAVVAPMYENGTKIIEPLKAIDSNAAVDTERLEFLSMANTNSNALIKKTLIYEIVVCLVLMILLVILSRGWGRISIVGKTILIASLPGLLIFSFFDKIVEKLAAPILGDYANSPIYTTLLSEIIEPSMILVRNIHLAPAIFGLVLLTLALILNMSIKSVPKPKV